jgi:hypothetical protein
MSDLVDKAFGVESPPPARESSGVNGTAKYSVYASYSVATWGWRTWEFAVVLILLHVRPNSLQLVSIYGILESLVAVVCGSAIGSYIDRCGVDAVTLGSVCSPNLSHRHDRLKGACTMYIILNTCVLTSAIAAAVYVVFDHLLSPQVGLPPPPF